MSPLMEIIPTVVQSFPRVSGDEPALNLTAPADRKFSSREWG